MRRFLRPLWFLLALLFLVEAWLWDHLVPAIRWIVDVIPWRAFKARLADMLAHLSPPATLVVFLIPAGIYFGLELIALWPMSYGRWVLALVVLIVAKIIGAAITAFAFDVTRDKLLQMAWFRRGYEIVIGWRNAAHRLADPYLTEVRAWIQRVKKLWQPSDSRLSRFVQRLRRKAQVVLHKR